MTYSQPTAPSPLERSSRRDQRLDFWRGLCLIDMVLVHLVQQGMQFGSVGHAVFTEYTRFAAGGYVMLSGMTVGFVYLPRVLDAERRRGAYFGLIRRSAYIFWIHCAVMVGQLLVLLPIRGQALPPMLPTLRDILLFREGYDLLPFYVIILAITPIALELIRRGMTWVVMLVSVSVFFWGHYHEQYAAYSFPITQTFFLMLWQFPFLIGLLAGGALKKYDHVSQRVKIGTTLGFLALSIFLLFAAYGSHFGLTFNVPGLVFWKNPLTLGELLRYLGLVGLVLTTTDLAWRWLRDSAVMPFVARLGRRSLAMYIAQIFLVGQVDRLNDYFAASWPIWGMQFFFMALAVWLLWLLAWIMDSLGGFSFRRTSERQTPIAVQLDG